MMHLDESHLDEIEYLLVQSMNGVHHLFDNQSIAKVLGKPTEDVDLFSFENMDKVQGLFSQLLAQNSVQAKRRFLHQLDEISYEMLVRTYFHIVDNSLHASSPPRH